MKKTVFWREEGNYYRIQTEDHDVHNKLKRRKETVLCGWSIVGPRLWIYRIPFANARNAVRGVERICGGVVSRGKDGLYTVDTKNSENAAA